MSSYVSPSRAGVQPRRRPASLPRPGDTCDVDVVHLDAVRAVRSQLAPNAVLAGAAELLALASNPTRLKILLALHVSAGAPHQELCVCDLAVISGASKSMTSHQLRLLRAAGLVVPRRAGKLTYYRLADARIATLLGQALHAASEQPSRQRHKPQPRTGS